MKPPFYRTIRETGNTGLIKTIFAFIVVVLRKVSAYSRHLPINATVEVNGSKILLFPQKGGIYLDLFLHDKREPVTTDYLLKSGIIKNGDTVFDFGANIGYYALIESKLVGDNGRVYAVEPVLSNINVLKKNIELNNLTNILTAQIAIGGNNCKSEIYISNQANLCRMKGYKSKDVVDVQEVLVETVDTFLRDKDIPKLIRMDVEGYEYEIIKGMSNTLKENVTLLIEIHTMLLSERINEFLRALEENDFEVLFAVFEDKVEESKMMKILVDKARGYRLPIYIQRASISDLKNLIIKYPELAPSVFLQKE